MRLPVQLCVWPPGSDPVALASKIDEFCAMSDDVILTAKARAFQIGYDNYSTDVLKPKYLVSCVGVSFSMW